MRRTSTIPGAKPRTRAGAGAAQTCPGENGMTPPESNTLPEEPDLDPPDPEKIQTGLNHASLGRAHR